MSDPTTPAPVPSPPPGPGNPQDQAPAMSPEVAAELAALQALRAELEADRAQMQADKATTAAALEQAQKQVTSRVRRPPKGERVNIPGEYDQDGQYVHHAGKVVYDDKVEGSGKGDGDFGDFVHDDAADCSACAAEKAAAAA